MVTELSESRRWRSIDIRDRDDSPVGGERWEGNHDDYSEEKDHSSSKHRNSKSGRVREDKDHHTSKDQERSKERERQGSDRGKDRGGTKDKRSERDYGLEKKYKDKRNERDKDKNKNDRNRDRDVDKKKRKLVGIYENDGQKDIRIERRDEFGRILTDPKEAFRLFSQQFHGKRSGKKKQEKRLRQYLEELKVMKRRVLI